MSLCSVPKRLAVPPTHGRDVLNMALVIPLQGPAGIFGPSCESCAALAMEEINAEGGVLGRELNLVPVDGGSAPADVATEVDALISAGSVEAVTGWHISAVREVVAPRIGGTVCDELYVPLGTTEFGGVVHRVEASGCEAVLMLLIGNDAVEFNRAFSASGLDRDVLRFSSLIDENVLLASGADNTRGLMTSAGYFEDLATTSGLDFAAA